jgi:large subunit ribosomal protein L5
VPVKARKSVAGFKLREGQTLGAYVTLRGNIMYEFLDRLVNITLPRVRDFRGVSSRSFDSVGNYILGLKEQIIFPEIEYDKIDKVRGLNISFVTTGKDKVGTVKLLSKLGVPFEKKD